MPVRRTQVPLAPLLDSLPEPILVFEPEGPVLLANRAARALLGHGPAEPVGRPVAEILPGLAATAPAPRAAPGLQVVPRLALVAQRADGTALPVEARLWPVELDGRPLMLVRLENPAATVAATARVGAVAAPSEADLARVVEQVELLRDEFVATLAHELRTPLQSMLIWTQLLRTGARDAATTARAVEVIERNVRRQAQLIDDLMDLAQILSGPLRVRLSRVRAGAVIDLALARVADTALARGIRIVREPAAEDPEILADIDRLERVLWKLLANALRSSPEGGRVAVCTRRVGAFEEIAIVDTGPGIEPARLPRIFDSVREASEPVPGDEVPRLRLSMVRSLIEMQGGSVHAESGGPEGGARFAVRMPRAGEA